MSTTTRGGLLSVLLLGLAPTLAISAAEPVEVHIYAAASLRDALQELAPALEAATGARPVFNLGASSDLARQIVAANKADVFFSADEAWLDHVARAGLVDGPSRRSPLTNRLVVIVPTGSDLTIRSAEDLAGPAVRRLSLANPEAVPAGKYAREWLTSQGQWSALAPRIIPALDVRAALAAVESGAVDAGIVYRTDAAISQRIRIAFEIPTVDGPRVSYALAALDQRPYRSLARAVVAWLCSEPARAVFLRHGFLMQPEVP